jgi:hypothetical protein
MGIGNDGLGGGAFFGINVVVAVYGNAGTLLPVAAWCKLLPPGPGVSHALSAPRAAAAATTRGGKARRIRRATVLWPIGAGPIFLGIVSISSMACSMVPEFELGKFAARFPSLGTRRVG